MRRRAIQVTTLALLSALLLPSLFATAASAVGPTSFTTTTGSETFRTRSGRGTFDVSTTPVTTQGFACPDRMTPVLVSVTFTDVTLTITSQTGTTTATFPDIDP